MSDVNHLDIQIRRATSGFIVGRSLIGSTLTAPAIEWVSYKMPFSSLTIRRGGDGTEVSTSPEVGLLTVVLRDRKAIEALAADTSFRPNVPIRVTSSGVPIFTGRIEDVGIVDVDGDDVVTVTAVDAVASLANTNRYGAVSPEGHELWSRRIRRLAESADVPVNLPPDLTTRYLSSDPAVWSYFGTRPVGTTAGAISRLGATPPQYTRKRLTRNSGVSTYPMAAHSWGLQTTLTDLTPGETYIISTEGALAPLAVNMPNRYAIGVQGIGWGAPTTLVGLTPREGRRLSYTFTATATSHAVRIAQADDRAPAIGDIDVSFGQVQVEVYRAANQFRIRDVAYESDLNKHFDLACLTVGGFWWPSADYPIEFSDQLPDTPAVRMSDDATEALSYFDLEMGYDTRRVVNDWDVENKGRDPVTGRTADDQHGFVDQVSVGTWGKRRASIELAIYTGPGQEDALARRMAELSATHRNPARRPSRVSYRAADDLAASTTDLYRLVLIRRRGQDHLCRVVGIDHDVEASGRHVITYDLR